MDDAQQIHPLATWLTRTATTPKALSKLIKSGGGKASVKYIEHIASERMEPGWHLCEVLEAITGIDARLLKNWRYHNSKRAA